MEYLKFRKPYKKNICNYMFLNKLLTNIIKNLFFETKNFVEFKLKNFFLGKCYKHFEFYLCWKSYKQ